VGGRVVAVSSPSSHLLGESAVPAGLFRNADHGELSAVVFTNACAISKFNRVGVSAGALAKGLRYVRLGKFYDRTPGALDGIPFCLTSPVTNTGGSGRKAMSPGQRSSKFFTIPLLNTRFLTRWCQKRRIGSRWRGRSSARRITKPQSFGQRRWSKTTAIRCRLWAATLSGLSKLMPSGTQRLRRDRPGRT
jgi:hypothetical protein